MLYEAVIPGVLPTLRDRVRSSVPKRVALSVDAEYRIYGALKGAPNFPGRVYIGFQWFRPNMSATIEEATFARGYIIDMLERTGVIRADKVNFYTDLCFMANPRYPRTVVCIADSEAELLDHFTETAGRTYA